MKYAKFLGFTILYIFVGLGVVGGCSSGGVDMSGNENGDDNGDSDGDICTKSNVIVRVLAIRVSDDDGSRMANISPVEVMEWLDKANEAFSSSRIQFVFEPSETGSDWIDIRDTDMNNVVGERPGDVIWEGVKSLGNAYAAQYLDKMVVFFRHGPGVSPTGGGFSSTGYNFIVMPGFQDTWHCGEQNIELLAHEIGHYFGLNHTFSKEFQTIADAEEFLFENGGNASVFDGDGLADTPPDPFIREIDCTSAMTVDLDGQMFDLLRDNIMSYYFENNLSTTYTEEQISILRQWLRIRFPGEVKFDKCAF